MSNTYVGEVAGNPIFKEETASNFYMDKDGTISTKAEDGTVFKWDLSENVVTDETGKSSTFGGFLNSLGSSVNSFLDIVNKTAQTYENTTGSKIIGSASSQATGQLSGSDLNTLSSIINSSINQFKKNALVFGVAIAGIVVATVILKNKRKRAK